MNKQGKGFEFLRKKHPKLCDSELKEGIYIRPQIREIINPSAWGHLNRSSYCDVGRLFYGVFKLWSKLQRKK
jgi:DNA topoisomerase IB